MWLCPVVVIWVRGGFLCRLVCGIVPAIVRQCMLQNLVDKAEMRAIVEMRNTDATHFPHIRFLLGGVISVQRELVADRRKDREKRRDIVKALFQYNSIGKVIVELLHRYNSVRKVIVELLRRYNSVRKVIVELLRQYNSVGKVIVELLRRCNSVGKLIVELLRRYNSVGKVTVELLHRYNSVGKVTVELLRRYNSVGKLIVELLRQYISIRRVIIVAPAIISLHTVGVACQLADTARPTAGGSGAMVFVCRGIAGLSCGGGCCQSQHGGSVTPRVSYRMRGCKAFGSPPDCFAR